MGEHRHSGTCKGEVLVEVLNDHPDRVTRQAPQPQNFASCLIQPLHLGRLVASFRPMPTSRSTATPQRCRTRARLRGIRLDTGSAFSSDFSGHSRLLAPSEIESTSILASKTGPSGQPSADGSDAGLIERTGNVGAIIT